MSDEKNPSKSILAQVQDEAAKARRAAAKSEMKDALSDWIKANDAMRKVEARMVEIAEGVGEKIDVETLLQD